MQVVIYVVSFQTYHVFYILRFALTIHGSRRVAKSVEGLEAFIV